jgi:hypothetical protein
MFAQLRNSFWLRSFAFSCLVFTAKMGGKPYHSRLEPFYKEIVRLRRAHLTWQEIADAIAKPELYGDKALRCSRQAVQYYFKRHCNKKIRRPMGMENPPDEQPASAAPVSESQPTEPMKKSSFHELEPKAKEDPYAY